jgi:hypothetical protein
LSWLAAYLRGFSSGELEGKVGQTMCISKVNVGVEPGLLSICPTSSPPGPYI